MDPLAVLAGLIGAVWSLPVACFGLLLGGMAAGSLLGRTWALWGSLLGTLLGGVLACSAMVAEFRKDLSLGALLAGGVSVPITLAAGLVAYLWIGRRHWLSDAGGDRGRL